MIKLAYIDHKEYEKQYMGQALRHYDPKTESDFYKMMLHKLNVDEIIQTANNERWNGKVSIEKIIEIGRKIQQDTDSDSVKFNLWHKRLDMNFQHEGLRVDYEEEPGEGIERVSNIAKAILKRESIECDYIRYQEKGMWTIFIDNK